MTSKLSTFVIDCQTQDIEAATRFWAQALQRDVEPPDPDSPKYRALRVYPSEPKLLTQAVDHPSRVHLDIESTDIEAEVARLKGLGATELERVHTWVVMQSPTGQRFCVVRPQRPDQTAPPFDSELSSWIGHYKGRVTTYLDKPVESDDTLFIEPMLGGRWLRLSWFGSVDGKPRSGEILLSPTQMSWADTFHTHPAIMLSTGTLANLIGSYSAGGEVWGWRTEWRRDPFRMRMFNVSPTGKEDLAISVDWQRL